MKMGKYAFMNQVMVRLIGQFIYLKLSALSNISVSFPQSKKKMKQNKTKPYMEILVNFINAIKSCTPETLTRM